ncbi:MULTISPECIES: dihydroxyacetone kinase subunit DhaL [unclassified Corallococcus]|uniref:dihydroxyacetone kinase subunit DhaL n=1 Tax=Corallococcus sp. NCSPR001 TaxID=2813576 RepID=UPI001F5D85D0|nr:MULTISPECIES: dihydroxyacetone kinase subunit DhaL [unclassified Corallococcus]WAS83026.1 dihydroxyacetone kinase subunit DhaL [Corallococcus sp. NCRR]
MVKKLVNAPRAVVQEMLEGFLALSPGQALLEGETVVVRADVPAALGARRVAVLSGGGSGHEPAHAGYVGTGMLHAAVAGDVFTSPSTDAVLAAIRAVAGTAGALLIVKNYTGDRLNFGLAAELARAEGIPTEVVVVADDVALRDTVEPERRRGIAGVVLVHKVAGAAAAAGASLAEVAREASEAAAALGSMGVALGPCTVPAAGQPGFALGEGEVELGLGIHGEQGVRRVALQPADVLADTMLSTIVEDRKVGRGDRVALMVNGLGGTPPMELAIVTRRALAFLAERGVTVERAWQGTFLSALEMPGCSLTLLKVDDARLARLDAPTEAPAWPGRGQVVTRRQVVPTRAALPTVEGHPKPQPVMSRVRAAALAVADAWDAAEARLTELDSKAGDGDLGLSLARGAAAIRALPEGAWATPSGALTEMGQALRRSIGGSSGPFYATALLRAARFLANKPADAAAWAKAFEMAVEAVSELGGAKPGDRTMVDALHPAATTFVRAVREGRELGDAWAEATHAAEQGAEATASMSPRLGRASYLGERAKGVPDAGAVAVVIWMKALGGRAG